MIQAIEVISVPVTDQTKSKEFYLKLGFQVLVEAPMDDNSFWVQLGLPNQATSISLISHWPEKAVAMQPGTFHSLIFLTDDIEKDVQELEKNGVERGEIAMTPWGKFTHFRDPDDNMVSLHQP